MPKKRHIFAGMSLKFALGDAFAQFCLQDMLLFRILQLLIDMMVVHAPAETGYADVIPICHPEYVHSEPKNTNRLCPCGLDFFHGTGTCIHEAYGFQGVLRS